MSTRKAPAARRAAPPSVVTAYIDAADEPARSRLRALRDVIREQAPDAVERISYGLATWHQGENLIHLGAFAHHVGVYPGAAAIAEFAADLAALPTSKGAIRVPHEAPLPKDLVARITRWRVDQASARQTAKKATRPAARREPKTARASTATATTATTTATATDVGAYHAAQAEPARATCSALAALIAGALPDASGRVWHGHPVWFLEDNPVVGYSVHKEGVRLLFWSGQSFDEPGLSRVGKFKAAEARFAVVGDIDDAAVRRWLAKARDIQWDYKSVAKRKGVLVRLR
jgi:uncharacterized protein YdhG (YjbR/CyaY superfamily)